MKIALLLFTNNYPYGVSESFLETEIIYLSQAFNEVYIIPNKRISGPLRNSNLKNVIVLDPLYTSRFESIINIIFNFSKLLFIWQEIRDNFKKLSVSDIWRCLNVGLRTRAYFKKINKILKKISNDSIPLIYFYWANIPANASILLSKNFKIIVRYHGGDLYEELPEYYRRIPYREMLLKCVSLNVFISHYGMNYIKNKYPNATINSIISRLGVSDYGICQKSNDRVFRILTCSNITSNKRLHLLVEALKYIKQKKVVWTHIGDGPLKENVIDQCRFIPSNIDVNFIGSVSNNSVREFYVNNMVDVFVNVSASEGVPVTIMEALSSGVPIVATNTGGTSELVDFHVGSILEIDIKPIELARILIEISELSEESINQLRINSRHRFFSLSDATKQYIEFTKYIINL